MSLKCENVLPDCNCHNHYTITIVWEPYHVNIEKFLRCFLFYVEKKNYADCKLLCKVSILISQYWDLIWMLDLKIKTVKCNSKWHKKVSVNVGPSVYFNNRCKKSKSCFIQNTEESNTLNIKRIVFPIISKVNVNNCNFE